MPSIQFLRRCVVETVATPPEVIRARQEQRRAEEANGPVAVPVSQVRTWLNSYRAGAWYGFDRGDVVAVARCHERGEWWAVDFEDDVQARIPLAYAMRLTGSAATVAHPPELPDVLLSAKVGEPALFFRDPAERGFWKQIVRQPMDDTNRLVYADWLDERGDPDAWIFRERLPFDTGELCGLKWDEAAYFLPRPGPEWASLTVQAACSQFRDERYPRHVNYHFADGSRPPQFVAYLLVLIRLRMWVESGE